jgi:hypothetical protein
LIKFALTFLLMMSACGQALEGDFTTASPPPEGNGPTVEKTDESVSLMTLPRGHASFTNPKEETAYQCQT